MLEIRCCKIESPIDILESRCCKIEILGNSEILEILEILGNMSRPEILEIPGFWGWFFLGFL
jgi:hypothetical protein